MRVITGTARGRRLREPKGNEIRPTTDQVKEALFNIIQFDVEGRRVLDLFAGTGQLGIEALSRGAESAVFLEQSKDAFELVKENLKICGLEGRVVQADSIGFLEKCGKFDIVFIDPPYDSGLAATALQKIYKFDILTDGGIIICETRSEAALPPLASPYYKGREYRYGKVKLTVYGREVN
jgi:16S rRNA (guanine966-N2)-methyltransferase